MDDKFFLVIEIVTIGVKITVIGNEYTEAMLHHIRRFMPTW